MQKEAKKSTLPVLRKGADGASMYRAAVGSAPRKRESEVLQCYSVQARLQLPSQEMYL